MTIENVAVIVAGVMGKGIAHVCAPGGFDVKLTE
jgi:3-hydroxyacyl-CoA dehydrogenase